MRVSVAEIVVAHVQYGVAGKDVAAYKRLADNMLALARCNHYCTGWCRPTPA